MVRSQSFIRFIFLFAVNIFFLTKMAMAQDKYYTKTGAIYFNCTGGLEKIEAINKGVTCVMDSKTGAIQFSVLMKGFEFEKALMQEHFNENYVESDKFPKSIFVGNVINSKDVDFGKDGNYPVNVRGKLTLHGETREVETVGTIMIKNKRVSARSEFKIALDQYKISIPSVVLDKIAKEARITVDCSLEILKSIP